MTIINKNKKSSIRNIIEFYNTTPSIEDDTDELKITYNYSAIVDLRDFNQTATITFIANEEIVDLEEGIRQTTKIKEETYNLWINKTKKEDRIKGINNIIEILGEEEEDTLGHKISCFEDKIELAEAFKNYFFNK